MKEELTIVQLTPLEAKTFITFQKHRALIGLLESIGAFNLTSGSIEIHFNNLGEIVSIDKHQYFNSRGK